MQPNLAEIWVEFAQGAITRIIVPVDAADYADQLLSLFLQRFTWTNVGSEWAWVRRPNEEPPAHASATHLRDSH